MLTLPPAAGLTRDMLSSGGVVKAQGHLGQSPPLALLSLCEDLEASGACGLLHGSSGTVVLPLHPHLSVSLSVSFVCCIIDISVKVSHLNQGFLMLKHFETTGKHGVPLLSKALLCLCQSFSLQTGCLMPVQSSLRRKGRRLGVT